MDRFMVIFKRDFLNLITHPVFLPYNTLVPLIMVLVLGLLVSGNYGAVVTSYDYYGVTLVIFAALNVSVVATNSFMEQSLKSSNLRVTYAPVSLSYIYMSKILATMLFSLMCTIAVVIVLHFVLGVNFGGSHVVSVMLLVTAMTFMSCALGVLLCCILKSEELANKALALINIVFALLGGVFFQLEGLGRTVVAMSNASPVRWASLSAFKIIYDNDYTGFLPTFLGLVLFGVAFTYLCGYFFRTEDYV